MIKTKKKETLTDKDNMADEPRWITECGGSTYKNGIFSPIGRFLHAVFREISLHSRLENNVLSHTLGFWIPYNQGWVPCNSWTRFTTNKVIPDPNTDAILCESIDQEAEKVHAFLERFPEPSDMVSQFCGICETDINSLPLATHNHPAPAQSALWHYQHFREAHFSGSTVKSALKQ